MIFSFSLNLTHILYSPGDEAAITRVDPDSFPSAYVPFFPPKAIYKHHEREPAKLFMAVIISTIASCVV